jgi:pyridoxal phosphate enzyme (YggS family)
MIGHLQKNKVKYISEFISLIHSLDRLSLANEIDKNGKKHYKSINCLIQIKISKEESKFGLNIGELDSFYNEVKTFKNINIVGLMGMATFTNDKELINDEFKEMEKLFKKMKAIDSNFKILSIGMSDDYLLAIQNGSNMIRVGSKIFGKRNY